MIIANPVRLRPKDFDRDVVIGSGKFALDSGSVAVQDIAVTIDGATMHARGPRHAGTGVRAREHRRPTSTATSAPACWRSSRPTRSPTPQGTAHVRAQRARHAAEARDSRPARSAAPSSFACATWARRCRCRAASSRSATTAPSCTTCASRWTTGHAGHRRLGRARRAGAVQQPGPVQAWVSSTCRCTAST